MTNASARARALALVAAALALALAATEPARAVWSNFFAQITALNITVQGPIATTGTTGTLSVSSNTTIGGNLAMTGSITVAGSSVAVVNSSNTFSGTNTYVGPGIALTSMTVNGYNVMGGDYTWVPAWTMSGGALSAGTLDHANWNMESANRLHFDQYNYSMNLTGTPTSDVTMTLPAGKLAASVQAVYCRSRYLGSSTWEIMYAFTSTGSNVVTINIPSQGSWTVRADVRIWCHDTVTVQ